MNLSLLLALKLFVLSDTFVSFIVTDTVLLGFRIDFSFALEQF